MNNQMEETVCQYCGSFEHASAECPSTVVTSSQAGEPGTDYARDVIPYRIDILGDMSGIASIREKLALARSIESEHDNHSEAVEELQEHGFVCVGRPVNMLKALMSVNEFAEAVGTTPDTVRSLARACGDKFRFAELVKSKLPDIQLAHGLNDRQIGALYRAATTTLKSLSPTQWEAWKGVSFEGRTSDAAIAAAIAEKGLLDPNTLTDAGFVRQGAERRSEAPPPEPILEDAPNVPLNVSLNFAGGSLAVAEAVKYHSSKPSR